MNGEPAAAVVQLRASGTSLVVAVAGPRLPRVLHWGTDLGQLAATELDALAAALAPPLPRSGLDGPALLPLLPTESDGWLGTPGVSGHGADRAAHPSLRLTAPVTIEVAGDGGGRLTALAADPEAGLEVDCTLVLEPTGVVRLRHRLTNTGAGRYDVGGLRALLPLPPLATEVLDLTGRWCRERSPQRSPLHQGTHARSSRRGRTGHDATLLLLAGAAGFGFGAGQVWSAHVAWSGDHEHLVERLPEGAAGAAAVLGGGELLRPGEVALEPGEGYVAPDVVFAWAGDGIDGVSARLHQHLRGRPRHPRRPRPVVLNTWEAVYFDQDLGRLRALADVAAAIGVERFVLDDGWFRHRRDDRAGLGDWYVDETVWPDGLHPLVDHVRGLGMQVGLWVEPEMVSPDSDLARAHPDWVLTADAPLWRHQQVLDVANPDTFGYLLERLDALVTEYRLDYLKWDHNRDLHRAVSTAAPHRGRPGVHAQTLAVYRLLDALRERHPDLEIESCASGGGRVDLGILERTDRVWASDTNDALERQQIQRWTTVLVPPELVGSHVGPPVAHTTGRSVDLPFRLLTAMFCSAGIEWDITGCSASELAQLRAWVGHYRALRSLLHSGRVVRADLPDDGALLHGVVSADRREAVYAYVRLSSSVDATPGRVRLPGLDTARSYVVRELVANDDTRPAGGTAAPAWLSTGPTRVRGSLLAEVGLPMPVLNPASGLLLHLTSDIDAGPF